METKPSLKHDTPEHRKGYNSIRPVKFVVEPPTLISLGFEWYVEGDENHNATVQVFYRKKGEESWNEALPLLRIQNERIIYAFPPTKISDDWFSTPHYGSSNNRIDYITPNLFAGSIFDLDPDTEYECRFLMSDPDGVDGDSRKTVTVRTRPEPQPFAGGKTYHVYPRDYTGPREEPAFVNLMAAYYIGWCVADWGNLSPPRVQPGDTILIHEGVYKEDWTAYGSDIYARPRGEGANFEGTYFLTQSGTPEKPIAIKAAGDGEVVFDGNGCFNLFNVMAGNYLYFEGITFRNTDIAFWAGHKNIAGCSGLTIKRCRFENIGKGIHTDWSGSKNFCIMDNVFIGRHNPYHLERWGDPEASNPFFLTGPFPVGACLSEYAVKIAGSGHVICHNYVSNFHDGIDHATYGVPDGYPAYGHPENYPVEEVLEKDRMFVANDIYNNFITNVHDDFIEADGTMYNIRVFRNLCISAGTHGVSSQPVLGGPVYFIRNILYHVPSAIKHHADPSGMLYYHNTFIAKVFDSGADASNYHLRNNLILGWLPYEPVFAATTYTNYSSSDYNGFCPNREAPYSFSWNSPPFDIPRSYSEPRIQRQFKTLEEYQNATGQDEHSVMIDYDVFLNVKRPDLHDVTRVYKPEDFDFRIKPNCAAAEAGCILPNVNDNFTGKAPDLGALEAGRPSPVYGPRF